MEIRTAEPTRPGRHGFIADQRSGSVYVADRPILHIIKSPQNYLLTWPGVVDFDNLDAELLHAVPNALWRVRSPLGSSGRGNYLKGRARFMVEKPVQSATVDDAVEEENETALVRFNGFASREYKSMVRSPYISVARYDLEFHRPAGVATCVISVENRHFSQGMPRISLKLDAEQPVTSALCFWIVRHSLVLPQEAIDVRALVGEVASFVAVAS